MSAQKITVTINITVQLTVSEEEKAPAWNDYWEQYRLAERGQKQDAEKAAQPALAEVAAAVDMEEELPHKEEKPERKSAASGSKSLQEAPGREDAGRPKPLAKTGFLKAKRKKSPPAQIRRMRSRMKKRTVWREGRLARYPAIAGAGRPIGARTNGGRSGKARPLKSIRYIEAPSIGPPPHKSA
ncbi:hypothetical protein [Paenibacillus humicola]|uniref:hypothetical protein n=1 Tax=Paenibacillus humicola TaxID=3110540 RepID=UPI00237BF69A|nr:hypothetical protein [Paenibacillus humicola]